MMESENDKLIEQLVEENKQLRSLLGIHREHNDQKVIESGVKELQNIEKEQETKTAAEKTEDDVDNDEVEQEIHESLVTYEQQMQRNQDDYMMILREEHDFRGYIHLKTIPDAAPELIEEAGRLADRLSINVEMPRRSVTSRFSFCWVSRTKSSFSLVLLTISCLSSFRV